MSRKTMFKQKLGRTDKLQTFQKSAVIYLGFLGFFWFFYCVAKEKLCTIYRAVY